MAVVLVFSVLLATGCNRESQDPPSALATTTAVPTTTTTVPTTTSTAPNTTVEVSGSFADRYPPEYSPDWETWAVFVFAWPASDFRASEGQAAYDGVRAHARSLGYDAERMGAFDLACSPGTDEALGLDTEVNHLAVAFFFNSEAAAEDVADAFEPFTVGYGYFYLGCAD